MSEKKYRLKKDIVSPFDICKAGTESEYDGVYYCFKYEGKDKIGLGNSFMCMNPEDHSEWFELITDPKEETKEQSFTLNQVIDFITSVPGLKYMTTPENIKIAFENFTQSKQPAPSSKERIEVESEENAISKAINLLSSKGYIVSKIDSANNTQTWWHPYTYTKEQMDKAISEAFYAARINAEKHTGTIRFDSDGQSMYYYPKKFTTLQDYLNSLNPSK